MSFMDKPIAVRSHKTIIISYFLFEFNIPSVIIDAGNKGTCLTAMFQIAAATSIARSWDIKVNIYFLP